MEVVKKDARFVLRDASPAMPDKFDDTLPLLVNL